MTSQCDSAHRALQSKFAYDPRAEALIQFNGQLNLRRSKNSLLESLCRAIAGQQLSTKAAATIWQRVKALQNKVSFSDFAASIEIDDLRTAGLSNAKAKTIKGLAAAQQQGVLNARRLRQLPDEELIKDLSQHWGVGQWTAEMCAIGFFQRANVWSNGDVGLQNALNRLYPHTKLRDECITRAHPYRSYLALHLWRGLDHGFFEQPSILGTS